MSQDRALFSWPSPDKKQLAPLLKSSVATIHKGKATAANLRIVPQHHAKRNKIFTEQQVFEGEFARLVTVRIAERDDDYDYTPNVTSSTARTFIELFDPKTKQQRYLVVKDYTNTLTPISTKQFLSCEKFTFTVRTQGEPVTSTEIERNLLWQQNVMQWTQAVQKFPKSDFLLATSVTENYDGQSYSLGLHLVNPTTGAIYSAVIEDAKSAVIVGERAVAVVKKDQGVYIWRINFNPGWLWDRSWLSDEKYHFDLPGIQNLVADPQNNRAIAIFSDKVCVYAIEHTLQNRIDFSLTKTVMLPGKPLYFDKVNPILHENSLILAAATVAEAKDYPYIVIDLVRGECTPTKFSSLTATVIIDYANAVNAAEEKTAETATNGRVFFCTVPSKKQPESQFILAPCKAEKAQSNVVSIAVKNLFTSSTPTTELSSFTENETATHDARSSTTSESFTP